MFTIFVAKITKPHILILLAAFVCSCNLGFRKPDVSDISLEIKIKRFDKDLFALKENADFAVFKQKYADFLPLYSNKVVGLGDIDVPNYMDYLNKFLFDSTMTTVAGQVFKTYPDLSKEEGELELAFKYLKHYFPDKKIPQIYSQISGFNQSIVVAPDVIGISLDKYLGEDCKFYEYLGTPMYARKKMTSKRIAQDVVLAYGLTEFPFRPITDNVISNMVYQGKIRYFVQTLMPDKPEADIMKYSTEDLAWCNGNIEQMWGFIIEQKHLFATGHRTIIKYINDGPFTPGMPEESPSKTGIWLGWQIVRAFMEKHEDYNLSDLMKENDYEKILRESGFQP